MSIEVVKQLAEAVKSKGGRLLLIGGCVRDEIMGIKPKDFDCEVFQVEPDRLKLILEGSAPDNKISLVGESFQVYKVGLDIDVSIPRRDRKTGVGHKGFTIEGDPYMSYEEACKRRDFTINAVMKDPLTDELIDPCNGAKDINDKILRMISPEAFSEDSLRVLRLVQFAGRFGFDADVQTLEAARSTDLRDLPKERVWMEIEKLLTKSKASTIANGIYMLNLTEAKSKLFPRLKLKYSQSHALTNLLKMYGMSKVEKLALMVCALIFNSDIKTLEDLCVTSVAGYNVKKVVTDILEAIRGESYTFSFDPKTTDYNYHKLSQKAPLRLVGRLMQAFSVPNADLFEKTVDKLGIGEEPVKPLVQGRDIIALGMTPSAEFGDLLDMLYTLQIQTNQTRERLLAIAEQSISRQLQTFVSK